MASLVVGRQALGAMLMASRPRCTPGRGSYRAFVQASARRQGMRQASAPSPWFTGGFRGGACAMQRHDGPFRDGPRASFTASAKKGSKKGLAIDMAAEDDGEEEEDGDIDVYVDESEIVADELFEEDFEEFEAKSAAGQVTATQYDPTAASWGPLAYEKVVEILSGPLFEDIEVYSFRVFPGARMAIRLDDLSNTYGSPGLETIENFSREFNAYMDAQAEAGEGPPFYESEVSSPGAERLVKVPSELSRFQGLPMTVKWALPEGVEGGEGDDRAGTHILDVVEPDNGEGVSTWRLAEVKANLPKTKGQPISKKMLKRRWVLPFDAIKEARLYIEI